MSEYVSSSVCLYCFDQCGIAVLQCVHCQTPKLCNFEFLKKNAIILYEKKKKKHITDNILNCHMVLLQCAPPIRHVVIFHFPSFGVNKEKFIFMKQRHIFVPDMCDV